MLVNTADGCVSGVVNTSPGQPAISQESGETKPALLFNNICLFCLVDKNLDEEITSIFRKRITWLRF